MSRIGIGLLGCGVVGSGLVRNLSRHAEDIASRCGAELEIRKIAVRDIARARDIPQAFSSLLTEDVSEVVESDEVDIVVELLGGEDVALEAIRKAMKAGKHIVTANKLLLARHGEEIFREAEKFGVEIGLEASVAGAVPIVRTLRESIAGGEVKSVFGIINGTANYILSRMTESDTDFAEALREAQKLGYAEADPSFDVEGVDAAHKIAILASLAFGSSVDFDKIYVEGITRLKPEDFSFARQFGKVIKLLAIARLVDGSLDIRVHPAMIPCNAPLARIDGVTNAVKLEVSHAGSLMLVGAGAGGDETSSAVISDLADIARNVISGSVGRVSPTGFNPGKRKTLPMKPIEEIENRYYLRFCVEDRPGVLSRMTGVLGAHMISVESAIQRNVKKSVVPLVIITHSAEEENILSAVSEIDDLETTREKTLIIRLENGE